VAEFNLEKARAGSAIVTRDGRRAEWESYVPGADYPVRCTINGHHLSFRLDGRYWPKLSTADDLFMVEEPESFSIFD
jgi:hypothetical protein